MEYSRLLSCVLMMTLLSGCQQQTEETSHYVSARPELKQCNVLQSQSAREKCYMEAAVEKMAPNLCEEIGDRTVYNICFQKLGKKLHDPAVCLKIRNDDERYTDCMVVSTNL